MDYLQRLLSGQRLPHEDKLVFLAHFFGLDHRFQTEQLAQQTRGFLRLIADLEQSPT